MCHTGRPLGGPCKHCSVAALITVGTGELGGGGCKNRGDIGMKKTDMEIEHRRWSGEMLKSKGGDRKDENNREFLPNMRILSFGNKTWVCFKSPTLISMLNLSTHYYAPKGKASCLVLFLFFMTGKVLQCITPKYMWIENVDLFRLNTAGTLKWIPAILCSPLCYWSLQLFQHECFYLVEEVFNLFSFWPWHLMMLKKQEPCPRNRKLHCFSLFLACSTSISYMQINFPIIMQLISRKLEH